MFKDYLPTLGIVLTALLGVITYAFQERAKRQTARFAMLSRNHAVSIYACPSGTVQLGKWRGRRPAPGLSFIPRCSLRVSTSVDARDEAPREGACVSSCAASCLRA